MKRKYLKYGDPLHFTYFNDATYANMNPEEKNRWMPSDEPNEPNEKDLPVEVIDFNLKKTKGMVEFKEKIYNIKELSKMLKADLFLTYSKVTKGKKLNENFTRKQIIDEIIKFQKDAND